MPRERMCEYGNCRKTEIQVTINIPQGGLRPAFCCEEHAMWWLAKRVACQSPSVAALKDIAYVGENGSPVDEPDAVAKWCSDRAKLALQKLEE